MRLTSSAFGEWPVGCHWAPGETRDVPDSYPRPANQPDPPDWLTPADQPKKRGQRSKPKE